MELATLIPELGFPAAVCVALFWNNRETVKHYEKVLFEFKNTLDANTKAMVELTSMVRDGRRGES